MALIVGTSGWQYRHWKEPYFAGVPQRLWFEHVLGDFRTVELNVSFYRLPRREVFEGWRDRSPSDAIIAVKASRYLTHIKRLRDPAPSVRMFLERATGLGDKLGPVLVQLPPDLAAVPEALDETLACFPASMRVAVEPRHESWWTDDVRAVLERRGAALVWADRRSRPLTPLWRTTDWGYLRLHEGAGRVWPFYGERALQAWVERLSEVYRDDEDAFVYFNNDPGAAALDNAITFAALGRRAGRTVTRVPSTRPALDV